MVHTSTIYSQYNVVIFHQRGKDIPLWGIFTQFLVWALVYVCHHQADWSTCVKSIWIKHVFQWKCTAKVILKIIICSVFFSLSDCVKPLWHPKFTQVRSERAHLHSLSREQVLDCHLAQPLWKIEQCFPQSLPNCQWFVLCLVDQVTLEKTVREIPETSSTNSKSNYSPTGNESWQC